MSAFAPGPQAPRQLLLPGQAQQGLGGVGHQQVGLVARGQRPALFKYAVLGADAAALKLAHQGVIECGIAGGLPARLEPAPGKV